MANQAVGAGCTSNRSGNPQHNPRPSTERGRRRHAARNDEQKKLAEKRWDTDRSNIPSRYMKALSR